MLCYFQAYNKVTQMYVYVYMCAHMLNLKLLIYPFLPPLW